MKVLISHMSDMRDGTFRPEIVIDDGKGGDIRFFEPVPTKRAAWGRACDEIELTRASGTKPGGMSASSPPTPEKTGCDASWT
jgi:hypothetical protein